MTYNTTTTLAAIRKADPCHDGWTKLLKHLGKSKADDEPLDLLTVLNSNGIDDALWVLSYAMPDDRLARHFQAWCAEQVLHVFEAEHPDDTRVRDQIAMLRNDSASDSERAASRAAALAAAFAAEGAASRAAVRAATLAAAFAASRAAVLAAALAASRAASRAAARHAALDASRDAAWHAALAAQEKQLRLMIGGSK